MSLPNYLAKIKSSGIYRFVWDKSEVPGAQAEVLRLVVGYSEKGPFNTLTYITKDSEFIQIYGGISKKLEKRGIYFHRLALQALSAGPILCLNLKKFNDEKVQYVSFDANSNTDIVDGKVLKLPKETLVESIYNVNRFWSLEPSNLSNFDDAKYITIAATDAKEASNTIFMRGFTPQGYNLSFKEWYSTANGEEMPEYLNEYSSEKVQDYFAEIFVFKGKFDKSIASTVQLSKYFDVEGDVVKLKPYLLNAFGEKVDTLQALASDENSNFVASYSGILLPNFKDSQNKYISLDLLFNADNYMHKMMMNFNGTALESGDIDLSVLNTSGFSLLKSKDITAITENGSTEISGMFSNATITPQYSLVKYNEGVWEYKDSDFVSKPDIYIYETAGDNITEGADASKWGVLGFEVGDKFLGNEQVATLNKIEYVSKPEPEFNVAPEKTNLIPKAESFTCITAATNGIKEMEYSAIKMKINWKEAANTTARVKGVIKSGDIKDLQYITYFESNNSIPAKWMPVTIENNEFYFGWEGGFPTEMLEEVDFSILTGSDKTIEIELKLIDVKNNNTVVSVSNLSFDVEENKNIKLSFDKPLLEGDYLVKCNHILSEAISNMQPLYLEGYTYGNSKPKDLSQMAKLKWQQEILSTLTYYPGIRTALTNRTDSEYRYIVDTFEAFVESECHAKLAIIAKEKDNAMAFLNFPSINTFATCPYTKFTDNNSKFQVKYIAEGGNKQKSPSVLFSLVSEANGASYVSYNTPLTFSDGTVKTFVPSAALVSNLFMNKYTVRLPYEIVAGPNYARIVYPEMVGPDFNFSREELDVLEPMGVNAMVYVPRKGTYINSNQTAKQNPVTGLSKINIRELCIFLQDEIESLLQNYQWEFNTQALRETIKSKADVICETVKNNGGLYTYLNICDESNNTSDTIDNEMLILSTSIEPSKGAGKMVHELTIYRKGGMSSLIK